MRTRQLVDLRNDVRKLADIENSTTFIPDLDLTELVNQGWTRTYKLLVQSREDYYRTIVNFTAISAQDTYYTIGNGAAPAGTAIIPADLYMLLGLDVQIQSGRYINCQPFQFEMRNDYQSSDWSWPMQPYYDVSGAGLLLAIRFIPPPSTATPVRLWYYPAAVRLVNDTDVLDGGNGWERQAILWAAKMCAAKDENYELIQAVIEPELQKWETDILRETARRNAGVAPKMRRSRYKKNWPWPGGGAGRF